jgi:hypothetical protein
VQRSRRISIGVHKDADRWSITGRTSRGNASYHNGALGSWRDTVTRVCDRTTMTMMMVILNSF